MDIGETIAQCAEREVKEETGVGGISLEKPLTTTYHTYDQNGKHILKESHWFLMRSSNDGALKPQLEEDISKAEWTNPSQLKKYALNAFPSVVDVLKTAGYL